MRAPRPQMALPKRLLKGPLSLADFIAYDAHHTERLKYVDGIYFEHVQSVAKRMHSVDEKIVALFHDISEHEVRDRLGRTPEPAEEEALIQHTLRNLEQAFHRRGYDISHLLPALDALTRRTSETYEAYIAGIVRVAKQGDPNGPGMIAAKVKMADLEDNSLPERNPRPSQQTGKDQLRLARYRAALAVLRGAFPEIILRPRRSQARNPAAGRATRADGHQATHVATHPVVHANAPAAHARPPDARPEGRSARRPDGRPSKRPTRTSRAALLRGVGDPG